MAGLVKLEVETKRLQSDIDNLREHLRGLRQKHSQMLQGIHELNTMWEGSAKDAFVIQFQSDCDTLENMAALLDDLIEEWENARDRYDKCENSVNSIVQAIRV